MKYVPLPTHLGIEVATDRAGFSYQPADVILEFDDESYDVLVALYRESRDE